MAAEVAILRRCRARQAKMLFMQTPQQQQHLAALYNHPVNYPGVYNPPYSGTSFATSAALYAALPGSIYADAILYRAKHPDDVEQPCVDAATYTYQPHV